MITMKYYLVVFLSFFFVVFCDKSNTKSWKDKDVNDMNDADMERIYDQWEENDEPLEPDELPEHLRPAPKIDLSQIDTSDPDNLLRMTKMGKSVMMFVDVREELSESEADDILRIWQGSLQNNHIVAERYPIGPKRGIFMFREGSQAVDAKNYLIEQPELEQITLESQTFHGKNSKEQNKKKKNDEL